MRNSSFHLNRKRHYLQLAFNNTLEEARAIISQLPVSDKIIIEAGTPLIKHYGIKAITQLREWHRARQLGISLAAPSPAKHANLFDLFLKSPRHPSPPASLLEMLLTGAARGNKSVAHPSAQSVSPTPYIVADLKTIDRGATEVSIAADAGATAAVAMGSAPIETLNTFIAACADAQIDAMIDMMNVPYPLEVLHKLKKNPPVVILHRGVDEERDNREKQIPLYEIKRIKGAYDIMIAVAGGDSLREVQSVIFNDADIAVIWKSVYQHTSDTMKMVDGFLKEIK